MNLGALQTALMVGSIAVKAMNELLPKNQPNPSKAPDPTNGETRPLVKWAQKWIEEHPHSVNAPNVEESKVKGLEPRVEKIVYLANKYKGHPCLLDLKYLINRESKGRNELVKAMLVFGLVKRDIYYAKDTYGQDTYQSAMRTMQLGYGDCDDFTILLTTIGLSLGISCWVKIIRLTGASDWGHIYSVWNVGNADGIGSAGFRSLAMDASVEQFKRPGDEAPKNIIAEHAIYDGYYDYKGGVVRLIDHKKMR